MDAVIGVALSATTAGLTLAAVDDMTVPLGDGRPAGAQLAAAVRRMCAQGARRGRRVCSVAVTWTADADAHVAEFSGLLAELEVDLVPIPLASAGSALASDSDYADTAVCVLEPDAGRGLRGRLLIADPDGPRAAIAPGLYSDDAADWLVGVLGELDRQPQRLVLVGADEQAPPVAAELPSHLRIDSAAESILALAHGAALASARDAVPGRAGRRHATRPGRKPAWLPAAALAAMVLFSALVATMPLGSAGPEPAPAAPPAHVSVPPAAVAPPNPIPPAPPPVVVPAPSSDAPAVGQKQNQSDTTAGLPEGRAPQAPPVVVEPGAPIPSQVAEVPDNCVVLCGFVL